MRRVCCRKSPCLCSPYCSQSPVNCCVPSIARRPLSVYFQISLPFLRPLRAAFLAGFSVVARRIVSFNRSDCEFDRFSDSELFWQVRDVKAPGSEEESTASQLEIGGPISAAERRPPKCRDAKGFALRTTASRSGN